jgi:predicted nuclease of predicted toxin-antitoxin system
VTFAVLADECLPRIVVLELRRLGFDVRYAAETDAQTSDEALLDVARAESRVIVTEDFDFGELLIRRGMKAPGAIILFMPDLPPEDRASRIGAVVTSTGFDPVGHLVVVSSNRIRQRKLEV